jgi:adenylate cyclase class 2
MFEEKEAKFLNIDPKKIEKKLIELKTEKIFEKIYKRIVFDYPDFRLDKKGAWVRLRDEGDRVTLTFKQRIGMKGRDGKQNDKSMREIEVEVDDFKKTAIILRKIGLVDKFYQENKRIRYVLNDIEFDIDFWPKLKPYLEIEAPTWGKVNKAIKMLGLNPKDKKVFSTAQAYCMAGIEENDYEEMTFKRMIKRKNK